MFVLVGVTVFVPEPSAAYAAGAKLKRMLPIINPAKMTIPNSATPFLWDMIFTCYIYN